MHQSVEWRHPASHKLLPRAELSAFNTRRNWPGVVFFCGHLGTQLLTGLFYHLSLNSLWVIPAAVCHGTVIVYWFQPFHECAHGTAFRTPVLNRALCWFAGIVLMLTPAYFYHEHMQHHRYTQHPQLDPERIPLADGRPGYWLYLSGLPYLFYTLRALALHSLGRFNAAEQGFLPVAARAAVIRQSRLLCLLYSGAGAAILAGHSALLIYWLIPRLAGEFVQRLVRLTEHQACPRIPDLQRNTRSVIAAAPLRLLGWYSCYHAEHHLSPNTPFHAMPDLHQRLRGSIAHVSPGYVAAHREIQENLPTRWPGPVDEPPAERRAAT